MSFTSFAKYSGVILGIVGEEHTLRYVTNRQTQRHTGES